MKRMYLAHPYRRRIHGKIMEMWVRSTFPQIEVINPFDCGDKTAIWLNNPSLVNARELVLKDLNLLDSCDFVFALLTEFTSIATPIEVFFASLDRRTRDAVIKNFSSDTAATSERKPVIACVSDRHPWLKAFEAQALKNPDLKMTEEAIIEIAGKSS